MATHTRRCVLVGPAPASLDTASDHQPNSRACAANGQGLVRSWHSTGTFAALPGHRAGHSRLQQGPPARGFNPRSSAAQGGARARLGFRSHAKLPPLPVAATEAGERELAAPPHHASEEQPGEETASAGASFDWFRQWYPMRIVGDLDPSIPHAVQLLGMDLVLWRDKAGAWRCFEDRCPHRLAALSEGRIDHKSGDLYCNYHGWSFEGSGKCTGIPQLSAAQKSDPQVLSSPRACAVAYPTRVAEGLLWVWANAGPGAAAEAEAAEWRGLAPALDVDVGSRGLWQHVKWYRREFPGTYIASKENAFNDPSHDTVLHHNTYSGLSRDNASAQHNTLLGMTGAGYTVRTTSDKHQSCLHDTAVFPSGNSRALENGTVFGVAYTTPLTHTQTQLLVAMPMPRLRPSGNPVTDLFNGIKLKAFLAFPWAEHLLMHTLIDADIAVQASVSRNRSKDARKVYTPAEADVAVRACWAWMRKFGGGGPFASRGSAPLVDMAEPQLPRRLLLDRYEQHTKHCSTCRQAHSTLASLLPIAQALAAALAVAAIAAAVGRGALLVGAVTAWAAAAAAMAAHWLSRLVQLFVFVDYDKHHVSQQP